MRIISSESIKTWFNNSLSPVFKEVTDILVKHGTKNNTDLIFAEWWAAFAKNTISLLEILPQFNQTTPFASTLRTLMESGADISFCASYPKNIAYQVERLERFISSSQPFTYENIANEARKYKLKDERNGKLHDIVPTDKRILLAYGEEGAILYDYICCFAHFNIFGIRIDLNIHQSKDASLLIERARLLHFYPSIFKSTVISLGKLCNIRELEEYDFSKIEAIFEAIPSSWESDE